VESRQCREKAGQNLDNRCHAANLYEIAFRGMKNFSAWGGSLFMLSWGQDVMYDTIL